MLEGLPSSTPAVERLNGFKDGVKQNPKIKVVAEQAADWLPDKAETAFSAMLQAHPDIGVVYASNDMMAAGSYLAAKGAGKAEQVEVIGTDGLPGPAGGIRAVASGQWAATFTYPTGAPEALDLAKKILLDCAAIGARHRDGADARHHQGQRRRTRQEAEVLVALPYPTRCGRGYGKCRVQAGKRARERRTRSMTLRSPALRAAGATDRLGA